jgi:hypothetical protein
MSCVNCDGKPPKGYTLKSMVVDATISVAAALKNAALGNGISAPKEEIERRQSICSSCHFRESSRCRVCGCYIAWKTALEHERCPQKFW